MTTITEWLDSKTKDEQEQERIMRKLPKGMPLKCMREIEHDSVWSIKMFSKEGWEAVNKTCGHVSKDADDEDLANGFMDFRQIWIDDNELYIDTMNPDEVRGSVEIFFDEGSDEYVYYKYSKGLEEDLIVRWSEYLLGD